MADGAQDVTPDTIQIQHDALHRQASLRVRSSCEPAQLSLAVPGRLVRHVGAMVFVVPRAVQRRGGRGVTAQGYR